MRRSRILQRYRQTGAVNGLLNADWGPADRARRTPSRTAGGATSGPSPRDQRASRPRGSTMPVSRSCSATVWIDPSSRSSPSRPGSSRIGYRFAHWTSGRPEMP